MSYHMAWELEMQPRMFSFNSPFCMSKLQRTWIYTGIDVDLVISNPMLSIDEGVVEPYANAGENTYYYEIIRALAKK